MTLNQNVNPSKKTKLSDNDCNYLLSNNVKKLSLSFVSYESEILSNVLEIRAIYVFYLAEF